MNTFNEIFNFVLNEGSDNLSRFGGKFVGGIHLQQDPYEFTELILFLLNRSVNIKNVLEIGSAAGGAIKVLSKYLNFDHIVLIDDNKHPKYVWRDKILEGIERDEIIGNSQDIETFNKVVAVEKSFDLIIIDADHTYKGVKKDTELYYKLLAINGYLVFHDINAKGCGIDRYTQELMNNKGFDLWFIGDFVNMQKELGLRIFKKGMQGVRRFDYRIDGRI